MGCVLCAVCGVWHAWRVELKASRWTALNAQQWATTTMCVCSHCPPQNERWAAAAAVVCTPSQHQQTSVVCLMVDTEDSSRLSDLGQRTFIAHIHILASNSSLPSVDQPLLASLPPVERATAVRCSLVDAARHLCVQHRWSWPTGDWVYPSSRLVSSPLSCPLVLLSSPSSSWRDQCCPPPSRAERRQQPASSVRTVITRRRSS